MDDAAVASEVPAYLRGLNEAQCAAACFGLAPGATALPPPLLVIAGAGTGKTNALAHRVLHLLARGADPERVLLLTFSRRAAEEMTRRVQRLCQAGGGPGPAAAGRLHWAGTFHAIGARLLREYASRIGLDQQFGIHDRADSADLMNLVRHEALGAEAAVPPGTAAKAARERRFPLKDTCLAIYSSAVNTCRPLAEVLQADFPWCGEWEPALRRIFRAYVQAKQAQRVLDYDDLLLAWAQVVEEPALARELGARFEHVLVDEYQDTNRLQARILLALKPDGRGLTVVGDDAQSIYAFRGATVRNILDFPDAFDPPAQRVALERNYRSTAPILEAANAVIALAAEGHRKRLWTERGQGAAPALVAVRDEAAQALFVVEQVLARRERGVALRAQAVLVRTAHHSARLEIELTRCNIPFVKFGGLRFLEAAHVKDVLALLRWAHNPRDRVTGFRALQLLPGVGPRIAANALDAVAAAGGVAGLAEMAPPAAARGAWGPFAGLVRALAAPGAPWPGAFEQACHWYREAMEGRYDDARVRAADIEQLARIAATYPGPQRFLTEITLDPPAACSDEAGPPLLDEDFLVLSTIHSAKGREWSAVTVLNVVDGCLPSDLATGSRAAIEEERRLLYVAMTRARDDLELVVPQRFYTSSQSGLGDRHVYAGRSRFLPAVVLPLFDSRSWPAAATEAASAGGPAAPTIDVAARLRAQWD